MPAATRVPLVIGAILHDATAGAAVPANPPLAEPLRREVAAVRDLAAPGVPEEIFGRGLTFACLAWALVMYGAQR